MENVSLPVLPSLTLLLLGLSEAPREVCAGSGWNVAWASDGGGEPNPQMAPGKEEWRQTKKKEEEEGEMDTLKEGIFARFHWEEGDKEEAMATSKEEMYAKFQPWVLATYGDSAKTKTITVRKAARIRALLSASDKVTFHNFWHFEMVLVEKHIGGQITVLIYKGLILMDMSVAQSGKLLNENTFSTSAWNIIHGKLLILHTKQFSIYPYPHLHI